ncbi:MULTISPECIES: 2-hydroxychromene-2-carboxylate isomerase [Polaromonas]|uniref:2-hydroxychromene-2-carboxylate isomerase n=1 Tax=Polaromonas aquatica TaxID=332657 RepID=A0ABW1U0Y5_9BURK
MQPIDFYFDFASPYGYFMSEKINVLAAEHGRTVTWRPILLFAALRSLGLPPPFEHPVKLEYITADFARSAAFLSVDYSLPPAFPALTQHAARAFYLLNEKVPVAAVPFAQDVLRGYFRDGRDISDIDVIAQMVCGQTGRLGSATGVRGLLKTGAARALLQNAITAAVEKKVFGSPFIVIDEESFFGVDRLPQIAKKLAEA